MEGNNNVIDCHRAIVGFTFVEALVVLAIIGILSVAATTTITSSWHLSQVNHAKAYLISIQTMQSRSWIESGAYLPLSALPQANIENVNISQTMSNNGEYEMAATLLFKEQYDSCRIIKISDSALSPRECW